MTKLTDAVRKNHNPTPKEIATALKDTDINESDQTQQTPLILATMLDRKTWFEALIQQEIDVNRRGENGATALCFAAVNGKTEYARALLKKGADVYLSNKDGNTPAYFAAKRHHNDLLLELVSAGYDPNTTQLDQKTIFDLTPSEHHVIIREAWNGYLKKEERKKMLLLLLCTHQRIGQQSSVRALTQSPLYDRNVWKTLFLNGNSKNHKATEQPQEGNAEQKKAVRISTVSY